MNELFHYGMPRRSGRYPWGSGENPQRNRDLSSRINEIRLGGKGEVPDDFRSKVKEMRRQNVSDTDIARRLGLTSNEFRKITSALKAEQVARDTATVKRLKEKEGLTVAEISRKTGIAYTTVSDYLKGDVARNAARNKALAEDIKQFVDKNKYVDIGPGAELEYGITSTRLANVTHLLQEQGYTVHNLYYDQMSGAHGEKTTVKVLCAPGTDYKDLYKNHRFDVVRLGDQKVFDPDGTVHSGNVPVESISSKRLQVRYNEEGGLAKDGLIEIRRGVEDLSLGKAMYAQVRIAVDGTHYLKGMAVYADDLPDGVDIRFNTNKHVGTPVTGPKDAKTVLKPMSDDPVNPFGAAIKTEKQLKMAQRRYIDPETGELKTSAINIVNEQGDWRGWSKNLPSQFLSKQMPSLIKQQLRLDYKERKAELDEINSLTNDVVKKKLLQDYAEKADKAAEQLKAAPLPGQQSHVLLPFDDLNDNEIYAPNYKDGTRVALIRYPHQGTFEIPELIVKNHGVEAEKIIPKAPDAVGINHNVAQQLSGADFDGDTATIIPITDSSGNTKVKIRTMAPIKELIEFDPKEAYPAYDGMLKVGPRSKSTKDSQYDGFNKGAQMGITTNLLTDMWAQGAPLDDIVLATKHAQVVIDAEKHQLNWKQSEVDNQIARLKKTYQPKEGGGSGGASTIMSKASSPTYVNERKDQRYINSKNTNPETGERIFAETGKTRDYVSTKKGDDAKSTRYRVYTDKSTGERYILRKNKETKTSEKFVLDDSEVAKIKTEAVQQKVSKMSVAKDAYTLTSGGSKENTTNIKEAYYAEYANGCKALANEARKTYLATPNPERDPAAAKKYAKEVDSLKSKLNDSLKNAPLEREAQRLANKRYESILKDQPDLDDEHRKKYRNSSLNASRLDVGASKSKINITDGEWEAIQNHAVSSSLLSKVLNNADMDVVRQKAMPRTSTGISPSKLALAKSLTDKSKADGTPVYTQAEVAERIGVSPAALQKALAE